MTMLPRALLTIDVKSLIDTLINLGVAFALGALIGLEREYRQRIAGLRTNILVAVGASAFVDLGVHLRALEGAVQIAGYVASGVGFLGAGAIMKAGENIRGLDTAATLWCSAAVGACAGGGFAVEAVLVTAFVILSNTALRPMAGLLARRPPPDESPEA